MDYTVIASEAKQSRTTAEEEVDCFVALLLAMTIRMVEEARTSG
jgi:hypothetical protein